MNYLLRTSNSSLSSGAINQMEPENEEPSTNKASFGRSVPEVEKRRSQSAPKEETSVGSEDIHGILDNISESSRSFPMEYFKPSLSETNITSRPIQTDESLTEKSTSHDSIFATHCLQPVTISKARQRNFLYGKSGANSLLGPDELNRLFPNREIYIFVSTWNMNNRPPGKGLNDFALPMQMASVPEVLVFGTQEAYHDKFEWEVSLQETLGPTHLLFHSASFGTLQMVIFLHRDLIWYASRVEEDSYSLRTGSSFRTKGAIGCSFMLFGTSFLFITAHLTAHVDKINDRISDIKRIAHSLDLPKTLPVQHKSKDVTNNFDYVVWFGDLNFRITRPRNEIIRWISDTTFPLSPKSADCFFQYDQLYTLMRKHKNSPFRGFQEAPITFPPTYKYDPGSQNFDSSSKQRAPAYTDRIIFKQRYYSHLNLPGSLRMKCLIYDSVQSLLSSDHKPVWSVFKVGLRPGLDTIPLAAGLFNREVYVEGLRRRTTKTISPRPPGTTSVCTIQ